MTMPIATKIMQFDFVELLRPVDGGSVGERGTVLDLLDGGMAMIELKTPPAELDLDRIIVTLLGNLRLV